MDTIIVTIDSTPLPPTINGPINACERDTATVFSVVKNPGSTYTWGVTNGTFTIDAGTDSITVDWTAPGPATVTVHETSAAGCVGADQVLNVTVNDNPVTLPFNGDDIVCANSPELYAVNTVDPSYTYHWSVTGGTITDTTVLGEALVTWGTGPTGSVTLVETNAAGCSGDSVTLPVTIFPPPPTPDIIGPDTVCENAAGVIYTVTANPGSNYFWSVTGGNFPFTNTEQIVVDWGAAGIGTITVIEADANGCQSSRIYYRLLLSRYLSLHPLQEIHLYVKTTPPLDIA